MKSFKVEVEVLVWGMVLLSVPGLKIPFNSYIGAAGGGFYFQGRDRQSTAVEVE